MANRIGIYYIKNVKDGKAYIGKSVELEKRLRDHRKRLMGGYHFNRKLQRAWEKHGESNFIFNALEICAKEELNEKEQMWITCLDSIKNGYNMTAGGDGSQGREQKEETKQKIRNALKGKPGHPHTESHKKELSIKRAGENNPMYGKPVSAETRSKLSKSLKARYSNQTHHSVGTKATVETRKKMSDVRLGEKNAFHGKRHSEAARSKMSETRKTMYKGGDNPRARKVACGDKIFDTMKDCAKNIGVCYSTIKNWLHGKNKIPPSYEKLKLHFVEDDA